MHKTATIAYASTIAFSVALGGQALAQTIPSPSDGKIVGTSTMAVPSNSLVVPRSSVAKPEDRGVRVHTNTRFLPPSALGQGALQGQPSRLSSLAGPPYYGYGFETPASLACLYGLVTATTGCNPNSVFSVASTKGSRAIALVDAYDYPTAASDLAFFSAQFGLPSPNITVYYATSTGSCSGSQPAGDPAGWEGEEALDVQMAHAMAPLAKIYLVEAQSSYDNDLMGAVQCANSLVSAAGGGEVSMSWGGDEYSGETAYDASYFSTPNIVYFASSGDSPGVLWPSVSSSVVSAGGTSIARSVATLNFEHYATWGDGGGGPSAYYAKPSYQSGVAGISGATRVTPDIAAVANPDTGVWVYDSNSYSGTGWYVYGGTSVASPLLAGIANAMGHFRANTAAELSAIYAAKKKSATADFAIPTTGYCGPYASYTVSSTWNPCVGVGTMKGSVTPLTQ